MHKLIAAILSTALISACSFTLPSADRVRKEPARPCATSSVKPGADIVLALVGVAVVAAGASLGDSEGDQDIEPAIGTAVAVPGALMAIGGIVGFVHGNRSLTACQERERAKGGTRTRTVLSTGT